MSWNLFIYFSGPIFGFCFPPSLYIRLGEDSSTRYSSTTHLPSYIHIFLPFLVSALQPLPGCQLYPLAFSLPPSSLPSYLFRSQPSPTFSLLTSPHLDQLSLSLPLCPLLHTPSTSALSVAWPLRVSISPAHSSHYHSTSNTP